MSGYKHNHGSWLWFSLQLHDGGSALRLNLDHDLKLSSVGQCLMFVFGWAHRGPTRVFTLALTVCEFRAHFFVSS